MAATFTCSTDDGHPSDLKMAELLSKHGLAGTFYIPIRNREGKSVMVPEQIQDIGRQFEIGSHTYDHCFLNSVDTAQATFQITQGKAVLENMLGREVAGFCYPGGKFRKEHALLVESAGFLYARTTMNLCFDVGIDRFEIATTCQFYPHTRSVYLRNFAKGGGWSRRRDGLVHALAQRNWITRLYDLFDRACKDNSIFHLWSHSDDIDMLDAWDELDTFLAYVSACVPASRRLSNGQLAAHFFPI
jgi:peptidoglycan/xylan/chitin deacetylase (PgdA/CDA1 family)